MLALGAAVLCAVPLRTVQLFTNVEAHTGFFEATDWTVFTVYAVLLIGMLVLFLLPVFSARLPASRPLVQKNRALALGSFVFAAGIAYDVILCIVKLSNTLSDSILGQNLVTVLFTGGLVALIFQVLCGATTCIYFILTALSFAGRGAVCGKYRLLAIMPLFWTLFRLVSRFITKISFTMVSELLMELAMLAFVMLFMMSFARVSAQINQKGEMKKVIRYGLPGAFLALTIGITRLICTVSGRGELLADGFAFSLADIGFGVFAAIYIFTHMKYGRPASEDDTLPDDTEAGGKRDTHSKADGTASEE